MQVGTRNKFQLPGRTGGCPPPTPRLPGSKGLPALPAAGKDQWRHGLPRWIFSPYLTELNQKTGPTPVGGGHWKDWATMETFLSTHHVNTMWLGVSKTNCQRPNRVSVSLRQQELNLLVLLRKTDEYRHRLAPWARETAFIGDGPRSTTDHTTPGATHVFYTACTHKSWAGGKVWTTLKRSARRKLPPSTDFLTENYEPGKKNWHQAFWAALSPPPPPPPVMKRRFNHLQGSMSQLCLSLERKKQLGNLKFLSSLVVSGDEPWASAQHSITFSLQS